MPYISKPMRDYVDQGHEDTINFLGTHATNGEFAYFLARVMDLRCRKGGDISYNLLSSVLGDLEMAKLEFYRRVGGEYERGKLKQNGEVYESAAIVSGAIPSGTRFSVHGGQGSGGSGDRYDPPGSDGAEGRRSMLYQNGAVACEYGGPDS